MSSELKNKINFEQDVEPTSNPVKKQKKQCCICSKKISSIDILYLKCRCEQYFCSTHIQPGIINDNGHDCLFDYKLKHQQKLQLDNPKIFAIKIESI